MRGAVGCFIVADCTSEDTLQAALRWKEVVEENCDLIEGLPIPILLMQNKSDQLEQIGEKKPFQTPEYLNEFAKKNNFVGAYQVSAKSDVNLKESMDKLLKSILSRNVVKNYGQDNFSPSTTKPGGHKLTSGASNSKKNSNGGGGCC